MTPKYEQPESSKPRSERPATREESMYAHENRGNMHGEPLPPHLSSLGRRRKRRKGRRGGPNRASLFIAIGLILVLVGYFGALGWSMAKRARANAKEGAAVAPTQEGGTVVAPEEATIATPQNEEEIITELTSIRGETRKTRDVLLKIRLLQQQDGTDAALALLNERVKITPHYQPLRLALAEMYFDNKRFTEAREELVIALAAESTDQKARLLLARTLVAEENMHAALHMADWILSEDKYVLDALNLKAQAYMALGDMRNAIASLQRILDLDSRNQRALSNLGHAYTRNGDYYKAAKIFTAVLGQDDSNSAAYYNLAICKAQMKDAAGAVALLEQASSKFGVNFVGTWIEAPEFDVIRSSGAFVVLRRKIQEAAGAPPVFGPGGTAGSTP